MNYKRFSIMLWVYLMVSLGCSTTKNHFATSPTPKATPLALGVLGLSQNTLFATKFKATAIPVYPKPIRMAVQINDFNAKQYAKYTQAISETSPQITYVDSIAEKPKFLTLSLVDQLGAITAIEKDTKMAHYIKHQSDVRMVTEVAMVLPSELHQKVVQADAIFLVNPKYKQYGISVVKAGKPDTMIPFTAATIFDYEDSCFCWGENEKNRVTVFDMVDTPKACPKNTYANAAKARKKINYLKL